MIDIHNNDRKRMLQRMQQKKPATSETIEDVIGAAILAAFLLMLFML